MTEAATGRIGGGRSRLAWAGIAFALLLGIFFRTVWGDDIEYKSDEHYSFEQSQAVLNGAPIPATGMPTSMGPPNTGASVMIFVALAWIMDAKTPPELARGVQLLNIAALLLLLVFICAAVPPDQREVWFWALALVSVNPLAVLFQRKIWPTTTIPIFTLAMIAGWWFRSRRWGSFLWGAAGSLIGQLHIPSAFMSLGFALWALLFDRRSVRWHWWLLGSVLVTLPALPWAWAVLHWKGSHPIHGRWEFWVNFRFWLRWLSEAFGFGIEYSLRQSAWDFLDWPLVRGRSTHGILALDICLGLVALASLLGLVRWYRRERPALGPLIIGRGSETDFTLSAAFFGFGLLLTASSVPVFRQYTIVLFFLEHLWAARLLLRVFADRPGWARKLLLTLCVCEALISANFLAYVHARQIVGGDYGTTWHAQQSAPPP